ncbi:MULTISPECIES: PD-(D/E)XK nuclease family protein [unclassified Acinetobacter]|uniref:PDDEXK-like family protein n=1 Tax=unclassified Acinetobacter TaxID=196816 RepID=UPI0002D0B19D|nr:MULTISPECIES: PD-(D/E)XK nuclease family protein [unclassified Acinetobacter]AVZ85543.1 hypothetical protein CDG55_07150 [Acinetobacter sp. WCHA45]ENU89622.1 hypothetical protein F972_01076 [Acinetobacter sp. CIP 102529]ENX64205.1 hypothetical protein F884_01764 [Acinetobacter sp. CIP 102143]
MNLNISKLLNQVSYELKALELARQKYKKQLAPNFSIFNYIYTDEMMLSRIIADLLNPSGDHAQGHLFLSLFLHQLDLPDDWRNINLDHADITVQTEKTIRNGRRMDIYIHIKIAQQSYGICIENKPFAADGDQQLQDYANEMSFLFPQNWHLVYLSGYGNEPAEHSVKPEILKSWLDQKNFSHITFPDLISWLKQALTECQNDKVIYFIKEFKHYIEKEFLSMNDISEQNHILNIILQDPQHIQATFELLGVKDQLQDSLIHKLEQQLQSAVHQKGWYITDHISRDHWTGLNIFYTQKHKLCFRIEFNHYNYRGFFIGIAKREENLAAPELFHQIHSTISELFPHEKVKQSEWWATYIDQKDIWDWQTHTHVWSMIESGELCQRITQYAELIYQALNQKNLLDEFNLS